MIRIEPSLLREKHPRFFYKKAEYLFEDQALKISFLFELENGPAFQPTLVFMNVSEARFVQLDPSLIQEWIFNIGLVEMLSYWKAAASPQIIIEAGYLSSAQKPFWLNLLHKGLSEYFFVNKIDGWQDDFVTMEVNHAVTDLTFRFPPLSNSLILPVGGGKDSAVSLELAKKLDLPVSSLTLNLNSQIEQLLAIAGNLPNIQVIRKIDPQLTELNAKGYLNGHTPFSALLAFVSTLAGVLFDTKYIGLSNEWSANEGNTFFLGQNINHQYSKTFEFEVAFRQYLHHYLSPDVEYFSWLRPLHEIQIAQLFSQHPQYFPVFLSCNRGQKNGKWCGECPKCLFVYILLSAFLPQVEVEKIWGEDLLAKLELKHTLEELTGETEVKSLECVGTRQESIYALAMALEKNPQKRNGGLWQLASQIVGNSQQVARESESFLTGYENDSLVPPVFKTILKKELEQSRV